MKHIKPNTRGRGNFHHKDVENKRASGVRMFTAALFMIIKTRNNLNLQLEIGCIVSGTSV